MLRSLVIATMAVALTACANLTPVQKPDRPARGTTTAAETVGNVEVVASEPIAIPATPVQPLPTDFCVWDRLRSGYGIPAVEHPRIQTELRSYVQHRPAFYALIERAQPFLAYILDEVEQRGLPSELALLPAVESGFQPYAYSPDGAAGLWQFMPATATRFGLERDWWYDGRKDPIASTEAALDYIEHLLRRFDGDVLHALAAYNAGGAKVARAIRGNRARGRPTDFWSLDLPGETDRYVPRLLALSRIVANPAAYGIALPAIDDRPQLTLVDSGGQIDLHVAAQLVDMPTEQFVLLNAGFKRSTTRPDGPHRLVVPRTLAADLERALIDLPEEQRLRWLRHRVRTGDTLSGIADRYRVAVSAIKRANHLNSDRIRAGSELLIPLSEAAATSLAGASWNGVRIRYRVRKGDSLYVIARRFEVSVADLRRWNDISGRLIRPGQQLTVFVKGTQATAL